MSKRITRSKAIRMKCKDCCCGNNAEIRKCPILDCPLYPFRMGNENKAKALMANMERQK